MQPEWAHVQTRRSYEHFTECFDLLRSEQVRWEPYIMDVVLARAPHGISELCMRDQPYWLTNVKLVYDIFVEEYSPQRVMRQFGLSQLAPDYAEVR